MKRKNYEKPMMLVVELKHQQQLLQTSGEQRDPWDTD